MKNILLFVLVIFIFVGLRLCLRMPYFGIPFDSDEWKNWSEGEDDMPKGRRWKMVNSLLRNYELEGMTVNEIKQLLG
ncbi:MAG: hypothetical protein AAFR66_21405, partial [Bacteroidota bacterium]